MRKLRFHEQKLLKKVDFISWEVDKNLDEVRVLRRYHIQKRSDFVKYKKLARNIRDISSQIKELDVKNPFRTDSTAQMLDKLYNAGLIPTKRSLQLCYEIKAVAFCRRRLPVVMVRQNMAESIKMATQFVEQGHVRVGPEVIMDPAFLVTRSMEDFLTWVDASAIKRHVQEYNEMHDDFEM